MATTIYISGKEYIGGCTLHANAAYISIPATYDEIRSTFTADTPWYITRNDGARTYKVDCSAFSIPGSIIDPRDGSGNIGVYMNLPTDQDLLRVFTSGEKIPMGTAKTLRKTIEKSVQTLPDEEALQAICLHPTFESMIGKTVELPGFKFQFDSKLWKTRQPNFTFQDQYRPGVGTESLYERIDETHSGAVDDPIPYVPPMEIKEGLYYSENDVVYRCTRNSEQALTHHLAELVPNYVEEVVTT